MYDNATNEPHRLVATSVGLAIPADKDQYAIVGAQEFGQTDQKAGDYAEDLPRRCRHRAGVDSIPTSVTTSARISGSCRQDRANAQHHAVGDRRSRGHLDPRRCGRGILRSAASDAPGPRRLANLSRLRRLLFLAVDFVEQLARDTQAIDRDGHPP